MTDQPRPEAARPRLRAWLEFCDELGLTPLVRRTELRTPQAQTALQPTAPAPTLTEVRAAAVPPLASAPAFSLFGEAPGRIEGETLPQIQADLGECTRCKLSRQRTHIVFGEGNPQARLVFVGEAPGADEDAQGRPFVGRAGQLLTKWIEGSLAMKRSDVYICNVIKCRPPGNRTPEKDEVETCSPFLIRQLDTIRPKLICCLGAVALQEMLGKPVSIGRLRGQFFDWRGMKMFATFHPAYLLRNPHADAEVQQDLRKIRQFLSS